MKSRTLCCDKTFFRKNMTRFAPAWVIYTICLLVGFVIMYQDENRSFWFHNNIAELTAVMNIINLGYALLVAQMIFNDLFNSRMCGYIHALPVSRSSLFGSYIASGMLYSIIPTGAATLLALALSGKSEVIDGWQIPLIWFATSNLQYLFFFAVAAFSALCVGNRFAHAVVYGILNFAAVIAYALIETLYIPMLYGVVSNEDPFVKLTPVATMASNELIYVEREFDGGQTVKAWFAFGDGWGYLAICVVLAVLLLVAAYALYRRRHLECAGDFMAVKVMEPIFLVVYTMIVATMFFFVCDGILGTSGIVYLYIGLALGFFTGMMLLERRTRVFSRKHLLKFVAMALAVGVTLIATALDPFGIATWIPEKDEVAAVEVSPGYNYDSYSRVLLETPEEIDDALRVHEIALENRIVRGEMTTTDSIDLDLSNHQYISLTYHLTNGATKTRSYVVELYGEVGDILIPYFSTMDAIFNLRGYVGATDVESLADETYEVQVECAEYIGEGNMGINYVDGYTIVIEKEDLILELLKAIEADAKLGVMAQNYNFRPDPSVSNTYWMFFDMGDRSVSIEAYTDCVNTNAWLEAHGFVSYNQE